jgi:very-short-patch-repair endonuclease/predicted transcriptional regulator of viral defense system
MCARFVLFAEPQRRGRTKRASHARFVLRRAAAAVEQDEMRPERRVVEVARRQHGCVSLAQLLDAGLSRYAVAHRVRVGWLTRRHRGVYFVGALEGPLTTPTAAVLAVGAGALLSHRSAAAVWELLPATGGPVDVTLPGREARHRAGIRVHEASGVTADDASVHRGLPLTSVARTLLDLADTLPPRELARAIEEAERRGLTTHAQLTSFLTSRRSHRGTARLRAATHPTPQHTRSEAERRFLTLISKAGLPTPAANTRVAGYEVDFLWPAQRVIVEIDGYAFHSSRAAFERDRVRDAELQMRGYQVVRITWRRLTEEPEAVAVTIATALAAAA